MSIFWVSDPARGLRAAVRRAAFAALVAGTLATGVAAAAGRPGIVVGGPNERITIGPHGVVVVETDSIADSSGHRATLRIDAGGVKAPLIEVDTDGGSGLVRMWSDIAVGPDEVVNGDVVAVFGSVSVEGHVTGEVVAVFGSVHLRDGSTVDGDVVSVGGALDQEDGATTNGQTISIGLLPVTWGVPALPVLLGIIGAVWCTMMFAGWLFAVLFPGRFVRVAATASRRTGLSLLLGLVSGPLMLVAVVLLFVTVIGVPIGLVLPFVYLVLQVAGYAIASYLLGCKLLRRPIGEGGLLGPMTAGITLVTMFFVIAAVFVTTSGLSRAGALFFGLLGGLVAFGLTVIGLGAVLLSRLGRDPADVRHQGEAAVPAMPAPPVSAPGVSPGV